MFVMYKSLSFYIIAAMLEEDQKRPSYMADTSLPFDSLGTYCKPSSSTVTWGFGKVVLRIYIYFMSAREIGSKIFTKLP